MDSLEPHVSRHTMEYHWGRHQKDHVDSLNKHIEGTKLDTMSLEEIIIKLYRKGSPRPAFSHAAQVWNHDFFWQSMRPGGGGPPSGDLLRLVERDFGSFEFLLKELKRVASTQFGSGWAWLTYKANRLDVGNAVNPYPSDEDYKLVVAKTPNAVNPLVWDYDPLLGIDLWEHAYYLDYENRRDDYISTVLEKLVSWEVVSSRLEMAVARAIKKAEVEETKRQLKEFIVDSGLRARPISIDDADGSRQRRDRSVKVSKDADKPGVADDLDDVDNSGDEDSDDADTLKNKKDSEDADDLDNEDLDDADARKKNEKDSEDEDLDDEDLDDADTLTNENGIVS